MKYFRRWCCAVMLSCAFLVCAAAKPFPVVEPLIKTFNVANVSEADVRVHIESNMGVALYELQCHSAGYTGDPAFDYSGDFECRLSSIGQIDTYSTLLTEDRKQSRDWESRGRFFASEIRGACAEIPQFGSVRSFKLRGMIITLKINDPTFTNTGKLNSLNLTVEVAPDLAARRPIAEIVPLPEAGIPVGCEIKPLLSTHEKS